MYRGLENDDPRCIILLGELRNGEAPAAVVHEQRPVICYKKNVPQNSEGMKARQEGRFRVTKEGLKYRSKV